MKRRREEMPRTTKQQTPKQARRTQKQNQLRDMRKQVTLVKRVEKDKEFERKVLEKELADELERETPLDTYLRLEKERHEYDDASKMFKEMKEISPILQRWSRRRRTPLWCGNALLTAQYDMSTTCEVTDRELGKHSAVLVSKRTDRNGDQWGKFIMVKKYISPTEKVCWPEELDFIKTISSKFVLLTLKEMQEQKDNAEYLHNPGQRFTCPLDSINIYPCIRFQLEQRLFVSILVQKTHVGEDAARKISEDFYSYKEN